MRALVGTVGTFTQVETEMDLADEFDIDTDTLHKLASMVETDIEDWSVIQDGARLLQDLCTLYKRAGSFLSKVNNLKPKSATLTINAPVGMPAVSALRLEFLLLLSSVSWLSRSFLFSRSWHR